MVGKENNRLLPKTLRDIVLSKDSIGKENLPPHKNWEWCNAGKEIQCNDLKYRR